MAGAAAAAPPPPPLSPHAAAPLPPTAKEAAAAAEAVAAGLPLLPSGGPRRPADELVQDVNRLMEVVRQEVTALMLEGVQKTASFCASQCAKHVVAARREMHQRLTEQRRDFERQGLLPRCRSVSPAATGGTGGATSLVSPAAALCTPRRLCNGGSSGGGGAAERPGRGLLWPHALPHGDAEGVPSLPAVRSIVHQPVGTAALTPRSFAAAAGVGHGAGAGYGNAAPTPAGASVLLVQSPRLTPRVTPRTTGLLHGGGGSGGSGGGCGHGGAEPPSPEALATAAAYDTYIDAHDAVQTLEERTRMASRAMELIEEALKVANEAGSRTVSDSGFLAAVTPPQEGSRTPRGSTPRQTATPPPAVTPPRAGTVDGSGHHRAGGGGAWDGPPAAFGEDRHNYDDDDYLAPHAPEPVVTQPAMPSTMSPAPATPNGGGHPSSAAASSKGCGGGGQATPSKVPAAATGEQTSSNTPRSSRERVCQPDAGGAEKRSRSAASASSAESSIPARDLFGF